MNYAIAIDIGGTNTRVAMINENYEIEERRQFATNAQDPFVTIEEIRKTIQSFGKSAKGIGISCPGPLDLLHGYILTTTNLGEKWWNYPICEKLSEATGLPISKTTPTSPVWPKRSSDEERIIIMCSS